MEFRPSITWPQVEVSENGTVRLSDTKEILRPNLNHSMSTSGPTVYVRLGSNYIRQLSLKTLVYEAWVKKKKIVKGEFVEAINGDDLDCRASNLTRGTTYKGKKRTDSKPEQPRYESWMGGDDIYMW